MENVLPNQVEVVKREELVMMPKFKQPVLQIHQEAFAIGPEQPA
jgi:hypothetical protein